MIRFLFSSAFPAMRLSRITAALLVSCFFLSSSSVSAQEDPGDVLKVTTSLVQLNVGVVDREGKAVMNLSRNEFSVYEDDVLQQLTDFETTTAPFSLVLLLDLSGSTQTFRPTLKQAAYRFLDAISPEDRVAAIAFNAKIKKLADFTNDRRKVAKSIESAEGDGETHFYDAMRFALEQLAREGNRRKAIVVLTDGIDTKLRKLDRNSAVNAQTNAEALASIKPENSPELNAVLSAADRQGVTIYPLALPSGDPKRLPFADPLQVAIYGSARARMQTLADRTGGRLGEIRRIEELGWIYLEVAADLRRLYTVVYKPKNTDGAAGRWRKLRIEVTRPELIVRTRPGYFGR